MEIHDRRETTLGKRAADIIISGGTLVNVYTGELLQGPSVAIKDERAYVGPNHRMRGRANSLDFPGG